MNPFASEWRPMQVMLAAPRIGQPAAPSVPPGMALVPTHPAIIDGSVVQLMTDATAAVSMGMLGSAFGKAHSRWSTVFWVASALSAFKGLYDFSKINK